MVRITLSTVAAATLASASFVSASPVAKQSEQAQDLACGTLLQPLTTLFDASAAIVGGNVENVLSAAQDILKQSKAPSDVQKIINSVTGGITAGVVNTVTTVLDGLSTGAENVDPACKTNAALCLNQVKTAAGQCAAGQDTQAQDACLQSKYTCTRYGVMTADQVDSMASCCSQYTASAAGSN